MSFSVSIDKATVVNNEAYTITTTSSTTLHSVDVYMNNQYYDKQNCSFPSNAFHLSEAGLLFFHTYGTTKTITVSSYEGNNIIRIHDTVTGSYIVDPNGSSTNLLGTPLYMTVYNNYAYVLHETEGLEVFRYDLSATTVTKDVSTAGLNACTYIANQSRNVSKFTFGSNGLCYLVNGIYDGVQYYLTLMLINIDSGFVQTLTASDVASSYIGIAMDTYNNIYLANNSTNSIERVELRYNGIYYNAAFAIPANNLSNLENMTYIYFDEFNVLYVAYNNGSTIQRFKNIGYTFFPISETLSMTNIDSGIQVQYSPTYQKLFISNNNNNTIYSYTPSFDNTFQYFYSPANISLIGNLSNGTQLSDLLKVTQTFVVNNMSDTSNPRYQESGNSDYFSLQTLTNRSEYLINLATYKNSNLINDSDYVNRYDTNNPSSLNPDSIAQNSCSDLYFMGVYAKAVLGSNVSNQIFLVNIETNYGGTNVNNTVNNITPYDIYIDQYKNAHVLHLSGGSTYYVAKYDNFLNYISQFTVEYDSEIDLTPRNICVDISGNVYVNYDTKLKKYNSSGTFVSEVIYGSGNVSGRKCNIDKSNEYIYISDNSFIGFYKYTLSLASVSQITLSSPPSTITDFDIDIFNNLHIMNNNNLYIDYMYSNNGSSLQNININFYYGTPSPLTKMRIYDHLNIGYISSTNFYKAYKSYSNFFNAYSSGEILSSESGNVTFTSTISFLDGSTKSASYIYRNHTYNVNTSSTNIAGNKNRISLNSTTDNNGNAILPERIVWSKNGTIKKESLRENKKILAINDIEEPVSIAIDSDNYLYVLNGNTYTVDVYNTATLTTQNFKVIKSISLYNDEETLNDLFVDANKNIYVLFYEGEELGEYILRKYNSSGDLLLTLGPFNDPYNIYVDNESKIYVTDSGNDEVIRYDSAGVELNRFSFSSPHAIAVDSLYNIYISNNNTVYKYDFEFNLLSDPYISGYNYISDMFIDTSNNLYITDQDDNKVDKYNSSGTLLFSVASNLKSPRSTVTDSSANIYIANYGDDSIVKYNSSGTFVEIYKNNVRFDNNIAVDGSGNIYTIDNGYVYKFNTSYNIIKSYKVAIDGNTNDIVCDRTNNFIYVLYYDYSYGIQKIAKLNLSLELIQSYTIPSIGYQNINSMAIDNSNNLYLLAYDDESYYIKIYNTVSETVTETISLGIEFDQIIVDTSNSNTIYILNNYYNVLYRYRYDSGSSSYVSVEVFTHLSNKICINVDSDYIYIGTSSSTNNESNSNKIYKYTLASDSYTETFAYTTYYPRKVNIYNSNVYILEDPNDNYVRIIQNNTQNVIKILYTQNYEEFICADSNGNIYVQNDADGDNLIKYDSSGNKLQTFDILYVQTMCIDIDNNIYVASDCCLNEYDRGLQTYIKIQKYNSSGILIGTIENEVAINDRFNFINYPLRDRIYGLTCDSTYLYVSIRSSSIIRFNRTTLSIDYNYNLTGVVAPKYVLYKNSYMYISNNDIQVRKYQITSTNGTLISTLNSGYNCQQFGVDSSGKIYIPINDKILLYQSDMTNIYSTILSLDADYIFIGPSNQIYVAEQDGSVGVYSQTVSPTYSTYYDVTEDGDYEIQVYYYDYTYNRNYEVIIGPSPDPENYIEYLQRIDLEMIPYYLYDAVLSRNKAQIINLFKSNRAIVSKLANFYQKMKNAHENPIRLNTPYNYNIKWYAKIRYDVSQPNIPYYVGYKDMYFFYLYFYNKTVYLNMFYLLEVAQEYYRTLLQAQRAINFNQDTSVYYRLDSSITNNYLLINYVNSFFNVNIYSGY